MVENCFFFLCFSVLEYVIRIKDVRDFCFIVFHHVIEIHSWLWLILWIRRSSCWAGLQGDCRTKSLTEPSLTAWVLSLGPTGWKERISFHKLSSGHHMIPAYRHRHTCVCAKLGAVATLVIPVLARMMQEDQEFQASLSYKVKYYFSLPYP